MTSSDANTALKDQYCAVISRQNEEDPIGSASPQGQYLLVELQLPWADNLRDSKHIPAGLYEVLNEYSKKGSMFRFLAFFSESHRSPDGFVRVFHMYKSASSSTFFEKHEYIVPHQDLIALTEAILQNGSQLSQFEGYVQPTSQIRDFFVCTHGSHDLCCGKFGYPIYKELDEKYTSEGQVRAWRVSHFGGHRHAPTLIDFPEGRCWAQLTSAALDNLVHRSGTFSEMSRNYRGLGGIGAFEQVAERELFIQKGWDWIHYDKVASHDLKDESTAVVKIDYVSPDQKDRGTYEAEVYVKGTVISGGCGSDAREAQQYGIRPV
ncbi:sucrase ferredoxin [Paenibacillus eucommiae]|uniref:Sucrase ferredoxin n=1 Tax=Paenibacillus eucommiae TaxID=1355755 RepID=A0ABS4IVR3_9BACL|nr:sucrase ferredoxin [Paenibacillus eucommiae]MBP1991081.1 hypothetical protein [Paenibacillus eucommiae]